MKLRYFSLLIILIFANCTSQKNTDEFIKKSTGRYLFNANEVLEIYFKEQTLHAKWRGNDNILPLKVNDTTFYMKELNEKMLFVSTPKMHIELAPKTEHDGMFFNFRKMKADEKTAGEYINLKKFDKALDAFLTIQKKDSLNPTINEWFLNNLGHDYYEEKDFATAIEIYKMNVALYPKSSNTHDRLGNAYLKSKDTLKAIESYNKALSINPENRYSKRSLKKITKK